MGLDESPLKPLLKKCRREESIAGSGVKTTKIRSNNNCFKRS